MQIILLRGTEDHLPFPRSPHRPDLDAAPDRRPLPAPDRRRTRLARIDFQRLQGFDGAIAHSGPSSAYDPSRRRRGRPPSAKGRATEDGRLLRVPSASSALAANGRGMFTYSASNAFVESSPTLK